MPQQNQTRKDTRRRPGPGQFLPVAPPPRPPAANAEDANYLRRLEFNRRMAEVEQRERARPVPPPQPLLPTPLGAYRPALSPQFPFIAEATPEFNQPASLLGGVGGMGSGLMSLVGIEPSGFTTPEAYETWDVGPGAAGQKNIMGDSLGRFRTVVKPEYGNQAIDLPKGRWFSKLRTLIDDPALGGKVQHADDWLRQLSLTISPEELDATHLRQMLQKRASGDAARQMVSQRDLAEHLDVHGIDVIDELHFGGTPPPDFAQWHPPTLDPLTGNQRWTSSVPGQPITNQTVTKDVNNLQYTLDETGETFYTLAEAQDAGTKRIWENVQAEMQRKMQPGGVPYKSAWNNYVLKSPTSSQRMEQDYGTLLFIRRPNYKSLPEGGPLEVRKKAGMPGAPEQWEILDTKANRPIDEQAMLTSKAQAEARAVQLMNDPRWVYHLHYKDPDIIGHIRYSWRNDYEGNRIMFIEEEQSDMGQMARRRMLNWVTNRAKELAADPQRERAWVAKKTQDLLNPKMLTDRIGQRKKELLKQHNDAVAAGQTPVFDLTPKLDPQRNVMRKPDLNKLAQQRAEDLTKAYTPAEAEQLARDMYQSQSFKSALKDAEEIDLPAAMAAGSFRPFSSRRLLDERDLHEAGYRIKQDPSSRNWYVLNPSGGNLLVNTPNGPAWDQSIVQHADRQTAVAQALSAANKDVILPDLPWVESIGPLQRAKRFLQLAADYGVQRVGISKGKAHWERWGTPRVAWKRQPDGSALISFESNVGRQGSGYSLTNNNGQYWTADEIFSGNVPGSWSKKTTHARTFEEFEDFVAGIGGMEREMQYEHLPGNFASSLWAKIQAAPEGVTLPRKEGLEQYYDGVLLNGLRKYAAAMGFKVKVGTTKVPLQRPRLREYTGRELDYTEVQNLLSPGGPLGPNSGASPELMSAADKVRREYLYGYTGGTFKQTMEREGSEDLARYLGGELKPLATPEFPELEEIHYIEIIPEMKKPLSTFPAWMGPAAGAGATFGAAGEIGRRMQDKNGKAGAGERRGAPAPGPMPPAAPPRF